MAQIIILSETLIKNPAIQQVEQNGVVRGLFGFDRTGFTFDLALGRFVESVLERGLDSIVVNDTPKGFSVSAFGGNFLKSIYEDTAFAWADFSWIQALEEGSFPKLRATQTGNLFITPEQSKERARQNKKLKSKIGKIEAAIDKQFDLGRSGEGLMEGRSKRNTGIKTDAKFKATRFLSQTIDALFSEQALTNILNIELQKEKLGFI